MFSTIYSDVDHMLTSTVKGKDWIAEAESSTANVMAE